MCSGFCSVELLSSPKHHDHQVGVLVEVSVNWMWSGEGPVSGAAVNEATGAEPPDVTVM